MMSWRRILLTAVSLSLVVPTLTISAVAPALSAERTLKLYYFAPLRGVIGDAVKDYIARVNEKGKGIVRIADQVIGPASIPASQLANAIKGGVVDIAMAPPSYFNGFVKGIEGMVTATVDPATQRKNGTFEFINKEFNKRLGAEYIGQWGYGSKFYLFLTEPITSIDDFKGMRLRASPTYEAFFKKLGAQPVNISRSDIFSALERGIIKGYPNVLSEIQSMGWAPVTKYRVEPGFYDTVSVVLVNKSVWGSLDEKQKAVLSEASEWLETVRNEIRAQGDKEAEAGLIAGGMKVITLSEADAKKFLTAANDALWNEAVLRAPEFAPELRRRLQSE